MSLAWELELLLPRLRRFARAATADKDLADACLERAIEDLIQHPTGSDTDGGLSYQVKLYRVVERRLEVEANGSFTKQAWRALILVVVEGFSMEEASKILGVDTGTVRQMIARAEHQVRDALNQR